MKSIKQKIICLIICLLLGNVFIPTKIEAIENSAENAKKGIVQVNTVYVNEKGQTFIISGGTGFLIGEDDGTEYVITSNHLVTPSEEKKNQAFQALGIPNDNNQWSNITLQIQVSIEGDVVLCANILNSSAELDVAVLQLPQPIYNRYPLTILSTDNYDTDKLPYKIGDQVYALGFPSEINYEQGNLYYSNDQVVMTKGNIVNLLEKNNNQTIEHNASINENNCGGPLVDENGYVIGVNTLTMDGLYNCSVDSTKITKILDGLGISYMKETAVKVEVSEKQEDDNELKMSTMILLCITIVSSIIAIVVVIIFIILHKEKKLNTKQKEDLPKQQKVIEQKRPSIKFSSETMVLNNGNCNTFNETSVLGTNNQSEKLEIGTLDRIASGEKISINKAYFIIGKDSLHVDYCIKDNRTISRQHAIIRMSKDGIYLEDCGSTNGTWLNGNKVTSENAQVLRDGDVIKLSNDEFVFHM